MTKGSVCLCVAINPAIDRTVTIPGFGVGKVNRVISEETRPGGKAVNVASTLAAHGIPVTLTGLFGEETITIFKDFCEDKRIDHRLIAIPGATRVGLKIFEPSTQTTTDINFPGAPPSEAGLNSLRLVIEQTNASWVVLSGSLPPKTSPDLYAHFISYLSRRGIRTAFDSSGEPFRYGVAAGPTLIKPNHIELEEFSGRPLRSLAEVAATALLLVRAGIPLVVVSMGAEGALFVNQTEAILARPPAIRIRSTVGAGDAMLAGLVIAQIRKLPLAETAHLATAFALRSLAETMPDSEAIRQIEVKRLQSSLLDNR